MNFGIFHKKRFNNIASKWFHLILCVCLVITFAACAASYRPVIINPELDQWDGRRMRYTNMYPPKYGYLETTEYDGIEFRKPHEIGEREYAFHKDPRGGIDRSKGYDAAEYTVTPDFELLLNPTHDLQITWIRHATFLIQLGREYQILVDPVLEEIDGLAGSLREYADFAQLHADVPIKTEDLAGLNGNLSSTKKDKIIVAISHDHFDHLNFNTLKKLPADTHIYVPRGLQIYFPARNTNLTAMDWYTQDSPDALAVHFVPANHRSGRTLHEMNQSLWGGWLFEWKGLRVYFAGDTGYSDVFKDIKNRYGEFDVCLMPISAWYQRHWHLAPEDAIQAAQDLDCKTLIPWGWGTWVMSFEHILEPPRRLQYAFDQMQPPNMELRMLKMGETFTQDGPPDKLQSASQ